MVAAFLRLGILFFVIFFIIKCICGKNSASGGAGVKVVEVVVWNLWWWFHIDGGGHGMRLCKGWQF